MRFPLAASGGTSILMGCFSECGVPETQSLVTSAATRLTAFQAPKPTTCAQLGRAICSGAIRAIERTTRTGA
jgi:hypothetical protein